MIPSPRVWTLAILLIVWSFQAIAEDWPRWRGPHLNGLSAEKNWLPKWGSEGPRQLWKANVGTGFSACSVANGRVYTMGNKNDQDTIYCFDNESFRYLAATCAPNNLNFNQYVIDQYSISWNR